ncbi:outer membrane lipoprotein carrier protein LolA [bacterium]|nr:outer membrane lipoprotein carrier protein LolA [bacterium]
MKIIKISLIFLSLTFLIPAQGFTQKDTISYILNKLERERKKIETGSFDFEQKILIKSTLEEKLVKGSIKFKVPDKLYVEYIQPYPQIIICNGKKVWLYLPEYNQVSIQSVGRLEELMGLNLGLFFWASRIESLENYRKEVVEEKGESYKIKLVPKTEDGVEIILVVSKKYWLPVETEVIDSFTVVYTRLENIVKNPEVNNDIFEFKIPSDAQVFESP